MTIYYMDFHPLFGESDPDDAVRDNAAGPIARLSLVLSVFLIVLPSKEDRVESVAVYSCVSTLVFLSNPQILSLFPELVNLFAQVVVSREEILEFKAVVGRTFSHLISLYRQQMQPLLSNLPATHANALSAFSQRS